MRVYIWQEVIDCTSSYHTEGGVVVVAEDEKKARALANAIDGCDIRADEAPTRVIECSPEETEAVFLFPNAGCC